MEVGGSLAERRGGDDRREGVEGRRGRGFSLVVGVRMGRGGGVVGSLGSGLSYRTKSDSDSYKLGVIEGVLTSGGGCLKLL